MRHAVVPRRSAGDLLAWALCGLSAGIAAGFLLSEMLGTGGHRRIGRLIGYRQPAHDTPRGRLALIGKVRDALVAEPTLGGHPIEGRYRGARGLELRGWVDSRPARTLAFRLARAASGELEVANRLLVRGEDDRADLPAPGDAPRSA